MNERIKQLCEEIDAAFFSSDTFHDEVSLKEIEEYLGRWNRKAKSIKETIVPDEDDDWDDDLEDWKNWADFED